MGGLILLMVAVVYGAFSRLLDRVWISAPMVFVAAGLLIGPEGADLLHVEGGSETVLTFTELTLATLLFADATTVPLRRLKSDAGVPGRLLSVGLLLTLLLGAVVAMLVVPGLTWAEAALIAAVLAPTDAALGMAVVTDKAVPVRIRRALNIESGLNDGIATPFVTVFLAVVIGEVVRRGRVARARCPGADRDRDRGCDRDRCGGGSAARVVDATRVVVAHDQAAVRAVAGLRRL